MIYTRFGGNVTIKANCGTFQPADFHNQGGDLTLLQCDVFYSDSNETKQRYTFAEFLKADNGWNEIRVAVQSAPVLELTGEDLDNAIGEAS